jgi:hypothetical protein
MWILCLQVRQHTTYPIDIGFIDYGDLRKIPATSGALMSEQVALESLPAHDFAGSAGAKPLGSSAAGFEFRHDLS